MRMDEAEHRSFREAVALYAADALPAEERTALEAHLRACDECTRELRSFDVVALGLALAVPQVDPPPALRDRVLAPHRTSPAVSITAPSTSASRTWQWSAAWLTAA